MHPAPLPWYIILLTAVPQTFLIIKTGFQLFNIRLSFSKALTLSLLVGIVAIFARELPLPFGLHTLILILFSTLLTTIITGTKLLHCFIAILFGTLILGVLEGVLLPVFLNLTATTTNNLTLYPWLNILYFLPTGVIMVFIYIVASKRNFVIFDLSLDRD